MADVISLLLRRGCCGYSDNLRSSIGLPSVAKHANVANCLIPAYCNGASFAMKLLSTVSVSFWLIFILLCKSVAEPTSNLL